MADECASERPHQIADREYAERRKQLRDRILLRKEMPADACRKVPINGKVIPLQNVADHSSGNHSAQMRGVHWPSPLVRL
jgi:hypothetical protein